SLPVPLRVLPLSSTNQLSLLPLLSPLSLSPVLHSLSLSPPVPLLLSPPSQLSLLSLSPLFRFSPSLHQSTLSPPSPSPSLLSLSPLFRFTPSLPQSTLSPSLLSLSPLFRFTPSLHQSTLSLLPLSHQKFSQDPVTTTLGGFSKVTNYLFDAFRGPDTVLLKQRPVGEVADLLNEAIPGLDINQLEEPGYEVITRIDLGVLPEVRRREPVGAEEWNTNMDPEGRMRNISHLKQTIFKGGLCHVLRKEGWKFLLGYFPWESTLEERRSLTRRKTDEYFRMKLQWKSVSEEQEKHNSMFRDHRSLIEKDVNRTDRTNTFYEGQDNPGLILLHDVLMTYCMYDFDLGYVQGMSDLLSPILYVMEDEVDAFWCFVSFMDQMHQNFEEQMQGMKTQLIQLSTLLRLLDLSFWNYLVAQDSGHLYFCFRWLLIRFKRELSFPDVLRLWEVMWTGLPCQNFHLLVCCAILDSEKHQIMEEQYGFNEILKVCVLLCFACMCVFTCICLCVSARLVGVNIILNMTCPTS
uniref:Rab-GAP TBC domain-containing protein n=2 Tax=Oncorhynchus tshawytscha TaxID=74940 RepID=A0AAZ3RTH3_ONCTS